MSSWLKCLENLEEMFAVYCIGAYNKITYDNIAAVITIPFNQRVNE